MPASAPEVARDSISGALALGDPAVAEAGRDAFVSAMSVGSLVGFGFCVAAAVMALLLLRRTPAAEGAVEKEAAPV
jgi:hypothetical protein